MESARLRHRLIVADRTASTSLLMKEVERRAAERPMAFALLDSQRLLQERRRLDAGSALSRYAVRRARRKQEPAFIPLRRETK